jgi:hypothetical protein
MEKLEKTIFDLENRLQQPEIRKSPEELSELIDDDFLEIGSSGKMYMKKDVLVNLPAAPEIEFEMTDFTIKILASEIVQSFFKTKKVNKETGQTSISLRSSIWKKEKDIWKMVFHQGTPAQV